MQALHELGRPNTPLTGLLVYVPAQVPLTDEAKQQDPFALYAVCGSQFPDGDGDEYLSLCLKAQPDHATAIRQIFAQDPNPSFAVIDAVGGGLGWPNLRALLGVESARDILFALLVPSDAQLHALKGQESWSVEARELYSTTLGLTLKTRAKAWSALAEEVWRFLLFSEFAFDLPVPLPEALANVPRAPEAARPLIEDLCERLRNDRRTQPTYLDRAAAIERELNLPNTASISQTSAGATPFPLRNVRSCDGLCRPWRTRTPMRCGRCCRVMPSRSGTAPGRARHNGACSRLPYSSWMPVMTTTASSATMPAIRRP